MKIIVTYFTWFLTIVWQTESCASWNLLADELYSCARVDSEIFCGRNMQCPIVTVDRNDAKMSYGILYHHRSKMDRKFVDEIDAFVERNLNRYNRIAYDYVIDNRMAIGSSSRALDQAIAVIGLDQRRDFSFLTYRKRKDGMDVYDGLLFFRDLKKRSGSNGSSKPVSYSYIREGLERLCGADCRKGRDGIQVLDEKTGTNLSSEDDARSTSSRGTIANGIETAETFEERSKRTEMELKNIMKNIQECSSVFRGERSPLINLDQLYDDLVDKTKHMNLELLNSIYRTTCQVQVSNL